LNQSAITAYLLLTLTTLFWAGNVVLARLLHADISAIALSFGRWSLATLLLLPFAWKHLRRDWPVLMQNWRIITVLSLLGVSAFNTLLYYSAHTTSSTNIALIQTSMPAMIVLLSALVFHERVSHIAAFGVALSIAGALLVITHGDIDMLLAWQFAPGDLLMLLANLCYAIYSVLLRHRPPVHAMSFLGISFIVGTLALVPLFVVDVTSNGLPQLTSLTVGSLFYIAIFPSILAYLFWNLGVTVVGANQTGFFICLIPVFTAVLAAVFLNEQLQWFHLLGLLLIVGGFVLFQRRPAPRAAG
jgi:drug/metabolite transporter (DMT)-like permease